MNKSKRALFTQFRCGILPLAIETGRFKIKRNKSNGAYRKLTQKERTCPVCEGPNTDDEFHFILKYSEYKVSRRMMLKSFFKKDMEFENLTKEYEKCYYLIEHR